MTRDRIAPHTVSWRPRALTVSALVALARGLTGHILFTRAGGSYGSLSTLRPTRSPNGLYVIRADGSDLTLVLGDNNFKREPVWVSG